MLCVQIEKERMTAREVERALGELASTLPPDHIEDLIILLNTLEQEEEN